MNKLINFLGIVVLTFVATSCNIFKKSTTANPPITIYQPNIAKSSADSIKEYRASATRINNIIHTKLDVSFDWEKQYLYGKATITVKPYFYPTSHLELDARGMEIKKVMLVDSSSEEQPLVYTYHDDVLDIQLNKEYKNTEKYNVFIEYIAKPNELKVKGGSAAITDDKGLYFINPKGEDKNRTKQIWTQGETQSNSVWFPTIDRPNERMTEEIYMTVDNKYTTLSNGQLVYQIDNGDGTRTDYWKMEMPHAPYLVMMAVGEFDIIKDTWRDKQVNYYVEKEYDPYAKSVFGNTPEMLEFYSLRLGVMFPWNKYAQVVVRDYVSGAMENTTAALFSDFIMRTPRELLDRNFEFIVSHELFHEWFGDMVTCESWSNIPLNESFATYGEYLWEEYKRGRDAADYHSERSRNGYFSESQNKQVPLIRFYYNNREDVFDAHSYNKGGQILHILRKYVGDDAFFASLKLYLETNKFSSVEAHNLRLAFEKVTGEDLNWFFNEWFFSAGHPQLLINSTYDVVSKKQRVQIEQTQDLTKLPLFKIPLEIDIYANGTKQRHRITVTKQDEVFEFDAPTKPNLVNVDAEKMLLCTKVEEKPIAEWNFQYHNAPLYLDRKEAIQGALKTPENKISQQLVLEALQDKFFGIRTFAIGQLTKISKDNKPEIKTKLVELVKSDSIASVRNTALNYLSANYKDADLMEVYLNALNDSSYYVLSSAIMAIAKTDSVKVLTIAAQHEKEKNNDVRITIAEVYSNYGSVENHPFYLNTVNQITANAKVSFLMHYGVFLKNKVNDKQQIDLALQVLNEIVENDKSNEHIVSRAKKMIRDLEEKKKGL